MALAFSDAIQVNLVQEFNEETGQYEPTNKYEISDSGTHALVAWGKWEEGVHAADDKDALLDAMVSMQEGMETLAAALEECEGEG